MRPELGEMSQKEFDAPEAEILVRLREIRERQQGGEALGQSPGDFTVTGVEASFEGDEH